MGNLIVGHELVAPELPTRIHTAATLLIDPERVVGAVIPPSTETQLTRDIHIAAVPLPDTALLRIRRQLRHLALA